jgi:hypothetical protein
MPRLEYFVVAESVSIDRDRNQVSIFNILEEICVPKSDPKVIRELVAISSWILDPEDEGKDFQVALQLAGPGPGFCPWNREFSVNFTAKGHRQRTQIGLCMMPIDRIGDAIFTLKLNSKEMAHHVLTVRPSDDEN